jgi:hypothetical protein
VRRSTALSKHKRTSITARLRQALARELPDGATWHAWRSTLAGAWARTPVEPGFDGLRRDVAKKTAGAPSPRLIVTKREDSQVR